MGSKRGGLGRGLDDLFAEQEAYNQRRGSRSDGLDKLIPTEDEIAARDARIGGRSLNLGDSTDPTFGVGYEVIDPAPTRGLGRSRAQKMGYNRELEYLAILMRDDTLVGYEGVTAEEWAMLDDYESTTDYIETVLSRYTGGAWNTVFGQPPQSNPQSFEQGTID
jgi:hypothetical protein